MNITKITINWNWGYMNQPQILAEVDEVLPQDQYTYQPIPAEGGTFYLSGNNTPWYRFLFVETEAEEKNPQLYGALGGEYNLTDGSVLKTRTGWSSREGIVNTRYRDHVRDCLVDVPIRTSDKGVYLAGNYVEQGFLRSHPLWPQDIYLIKTTDWLAGEVYFIPSIMPGEVVKAVKPPNTDRFGREI